MLTPVNCIHWKAPNIFKRNTNIPPSTPFWLEATQTAWRNLSNQLCYFCFVFKWEHSNIGVGSKCYLANLLFQCFHVTRHRFLMMMSWSCSAVSVCTRMVWIKQTGQSQQTEKKEKKDCTSATLTNSDMNHNETMNSQQSASLWFWLSTSWLLSVSNTRQRGRITC